MKNIFILFLLISGSVSAQNNTTYFDRADEFFQKYVHNGKVKYAEIKQNPKALNELMAEAKKAKVSLENEAEYKAFWINAYNIAVIKGIVESYPVKSLMDIRGFFNEKKFSLGQQSVTLDEIQKKLLFGNFPEEEWFHFVLVCAAKSCPPVINKAYRPEILEEQLEQQTIKALNDPQFVRVTGNKVLFSEIMNWYNPDFTQNGDSLIEYVNRYRIKKIPANLQTGFYEYNWQLNDL